jgi:hypothetical protein
MAPKKGAKKAAPKTKAKKTSAAPKKSAAVKPSEVMKMPSERKLKDLARQYQNCKETTSELGGRMGSAMRTMADNDGLHPQAFRQAMSELKKEPGRLNDFLAHLDFYRDVLGVVARAESAPRLPMGDEVGAEDGGDENENVITGSGEAEEATEQEQDDNVHQLPFAAEA